MNPTTPGVLAVDCGSTSFKAALFDTRLERLGEASVPLDYSRHGNVVVELSGESLWAAFLTLVSDVCRSAAVPSQEIRAVALGSQAQTFALCDPSARPLTPFLSWQDRRAEEEANEAATLLGRDFHSHCSFAPPIPQLQLCKLRWLTRHQPGALSGRSVLSSLPSFLAWRLGVPNSTDRNLAAMGGLYSLRLGAWWPAAMDFCGVSADHLPGLIDVGSTVVAEQTPGTKAFRSGLRVTFAGNDQTVGAYGNGCEQGGMVITLGTALVVYRHAGRRPGPYHAGGCWGPYPGGSYYELATIDEGCKALDWARARLLPDCSAAEFDAVARGAISAGRAADAPRFHPDRIPCGRPWSTPPTDVQTAAYAVLEGICFALRRLLEGALQDLGRRRRTAVIGGGSRSDLWLELLAQVLGSAVTRGSGDALLGAAALSLGVPVPRQPAGAAIWRPDPGRAPAIEARYRQWLADP